MRDTKGDGFGDYNVKIEKNVNLTRNDSNLKNSKSLSTINKLINADDNVAKQSKVTN